MQAFFDQQQRILADAIDPETNTVGHFVKQIYGYAEGGLVDSGLREESSNLGAIQRVIGAAQKTFGNQDASITDSILGKQSSYGSPTFLSQHYTQLGKFFGAGTEPGNAYTNHYTTPQRGQAAQAQNPNDFYSRWYESMRRFAQAEEVAAKGQTQIRTR